MLGDDEVRELFRLVDGGLLIVQAARRIGRSERVARQYVKARRLPSQMKKERIYRTRADPFEEVWPQLVAVLEAAPRLEAKTLFGDLCERDPGRWQEGQLRTLQRRVRDWRALNGPDREIFFPQVHHPGKRGESDFTCMNDLEITIGGEPFPHKLYHFVLTYSNWEYAEIARSESFAALKQGFQNAVWELGGVAQEHRTDNTSTATHDLKNERGRGFNAAYLRLVEHYGTEPTKNTPGKGHENGDVEKSHDVLKGAVRQRLLLRQSREFESRPVYEAFLRDVVSSLNASRTVRLAEDRSALKPLPPRRLEDYEECEAVVGRASTILVLQNHYSVPARLIGHRVKVHVYAEELEVFYMGRRVESFPRLVGTKLARVNYRHVIGWLVRKPGAFENYRYRDELFPRLVFRETYDRLCERVPARATIEYLRVLKLAAETMEGNVVKALEELLAAGELPDSEAVRARVAPRSPERPEVNVQEPSLHIYDKLLLAEAVA